MKEGDGHVIILSIVSIFYFLFSFSFCYCVCVCNSFIPQWCQRPWPFHLHLTHSPSFFLLFLSFRHFHHHHHLLLFLSLRLNLSKTSHSGSLPESNVFELKEKVQAQRQVLIPRLVLPFTNLNPTKFLSLMLPIPSLLLFKTENFASKSISRTFSLSLSIFSFSLHFPFPDFLLGILSAGPCQATFLHIRYYSLLSWTKNVWLISRLHVCFWGSLHLTSSSTGLIKLISCFEKLF